MTRSMSCLLPMRIEIHGAAHQFDFVHLVAVVVDQQLAESDLGGFAQPDRAVVFKLDFSQAVGCR